MSRPATTKGTAPLSRVGHDSDADRPPLGARDQAITHTRYGSSTFDQVALGR